MSTPGGPGDSGAACCEAGPQACVLAKALLARHAVCALAERRSLGERELLLCTQPPARRRCETWLGLLRERARFALRLPRPEAPLMHARAMQLQCGGLLALRAQADPAAAGPPEAQALLAWAEQHWDGLDQAPWDRIVPLLAQWQPRRRGPRASP